MLRRCAVTGLLSGVGLGLYIHTETCHAINTAFAISQMFEPEQSKMRFSVESCLGSPFTGFLQLKNVRAERLHSTDTQSAFSLAIKQAEVTFSPLSHRYNRLPILYDIFVQGVNGTVTVAPDSPPLPPLMLQNLAVRDVSLQVRTHRDLSLAAVPLHVERLSADKLLLSQAPLDMMFFANAHGRFGDADWKTVPMKAGAVGSWSVNNLSLEQLLPFFCPRESALRAIKSASVNLAVTDSASDCATLYDVLANRHAEQSPEQTAAAIVPPAAAVNPPQTPEALDGAKQFKARQRLRERKQAGENVNSWASRMRAKLDAKLESGGNALTSARDLVVALADDSASSGERRVNGEPWAVAMDCNVGISHFKGHLPLLSAAEPATAGGSSGQKKKKTGSALLLDAARSVAVTGADELGTHVHDRLFPAQLAVQVRVTHEELRAATTSGHAASGIGLLLTRTVCGALLAGGAGGNGTATAAKIVAAAGRKLAGPAQGGGR